MGKGNFRYTRRHFLATAAATAAAAALPFAPIQAAAKFRRYSVTSAMGQKMLGSYSKGIAAMLKLPPDHPQNWFRNAFIHILDCPHGNWWFYVWHRGYLGYFEQTIRELSGDTDFTIPYWDWTELPEIPPAMFEGVLTPTDKAFEPYTSDLDVFATYLKPSLISYWNGLSPDQLAQLKVRGYSAFEDVWNDVTGYDPATKMVNVGNEAFAPTSHARYLNSANPKLDEKTAYDVSPFVVNAGLQLPTDFYNREIYLSFSSSKTKSHHEQPGDKTKFSLLEGLPHNKTHNYIGGAGPLDPGPYGNMTNFLSSVDPIFFLHHANMDRLWDLWTRIQMSLKRPYLPSGDDLKLLSDEPFLFYVDGKGKYAGPQAAGSYLSTELFDYDYEPGFGEKLIQQQPGGPTTLIKGTVSANVGRITVPRATIQKYLAAAFQKPIIVSVSLPHPTGSLSTREFDVLVNAPSSVTRVTASSPFYAGTIAFFGSTMGRMNVAHDSTFAVPLRKSLQAFTTLGLDSSTTLQIRVVPTNGRRENTPVLKGVALTAM